MPGFKPLYQRHLIIKSQRKSQFIQKKGLRALSYELAYFNRRNINTTLPSYLKSCNKLTLNLINKPFLAKLSHYIQKVKTLVLDVTFLKSIFTHTHSLKNLQKLQLIGQLIPAPPKMIYARKLKPLRKLISFENQTTLDLELSRLAKFSKKITTSSTIVPSPFRIRYITHLGIDLVKAQYQEPVSISILKTLWSSIKHFKHLKTLDVAVILTPLSKGIIPHLNVPSRAGSKFEYKLQLYLQNIEKSRTVANPAAMIGTFLQKLDADQIKIEDMTYTREIDTGSYQDELVRSDADYSLMIQLFMISKKKNVVIESLGYYSHINTLITKTDIINVIKQTNVKLNTLYLNYSLDKYNPNTFAAFEKLIAVAKSVKTLAVAFEDLHPNTVKEFMNILSKFKQTTPECLLILNCRSIDSLKNMFPLCKSFESISRIKELHLKIKQDFVPKTFKDLSGVVKELAFENRINKFTLELKNQASLTKIPQNITYSLLEFLHAYTKHSTSSKSFEMEVHVPYTDLEPQDPSVGDYLGFLNVLVAKIFPINFNIGFQPY